MAQAHPEERTLQYAEGEMKVVANLITHLREKCHAQLYGLKKGLPEFCEAGIEAAKSELA